MISRAVWFCAAVIILSMSCFVILVDEERSCADGVGVGFTSGVDIELLACVFAFVVLSSFGVEASTSGKAVASLRSSSVSNGVSSGSPFASRREFLSGLDMFAVFCYSS